MRAGDAIGCIQHGGRVPRLEYEPAGQWLLILCIAYLLTLHLSPRRRTLRGGDYWGWALGLALFLVFGQFYIIAKIWAFYIAVSFGLSLLVRRRVVCGSRRQDLWWYGLWTTMILVGSIAKEINYILHEGLWPFYWPSRVIDVQPELLGYLGLVVICEIVCVIRRDEHRGYWPRADASKS